jgi:hypothetical protein
MLGSIRRENNMEQLPRGETVDLLNRQSSYIDVTLFWVRGTMNTFVSVEMQDGNSFCVDVPEGEDPIHYFDHPMVYSPFDEKGRMLYAATEANQ